MLDPIGRYEDTPLTNFQAQTFLDEKCRRLLRAALQDTPGVMLTDRMVQALKTNMVLAHQFLYGRSSLTIARIIVEWNDRTAAHYATLYAEARIGMVATTTNRIPKTKTNSKTENRKVTSIQEIFQGA